MLLQLIFLSGLVKVDFVTSICNHHSAVVANFNICCTLESCSDSLDQLSTWAVHQQFGWI